MKLMPSINLESLLRFLGICLAVAMVAILAWRMAGWAWYFLAPRTQTTVPDLRGTTSIPKISLYPWFGTVTRPSTQVSSNIRLIGLFAGGRRPAAIVAIDNQNPIAVVTGETPSPGLKLTRIADDHIVVERNGTSERINLSGVTALIQQEIKGKEIHPK